MKQECGKYVCVYCFVFSCVRVCQRWQTKKVWNASVTIVRMFSKQERKPKYEHYKHWAMSTQHIYNITMSVITIEPWQKHNVTSLMGQDRINIHQVLSSLFSFHLFSHLRFRWTQKTECFSAMFILRHCERCFEAIRSIHCEMLIYCG